MNSKLKDLKFDIELRQQQHQQDLEVIKESQTRELEKLRSKVKQQIIEDFESTTEEIKNNYHLGLINIYQYAQFNEETVTTFKEGLNYLTEL